MSTKYAIDVIEREIEKLNNTKFEINADISTLTKQLTSIDITISSLQSSIRALRDKSSFLDNTDLVKICLYSGPTGLRIKTSSKPTEDSINNSLKEIGGKLDYRRSAIFGVTHESVARSIVNSLKLQAHEYKTDTPHVFKTEAFDRLLSFMLSASECLSVKDFDLFKTPTPEFTLIPKKLAPTFETMEETAAWAVSHYDQMMKNKADEGIMKTAKMSMDVNELLGALKVI